MVSSGLPNKCWPLCLPNNRRDGTNTHIHYQSRKSLTNKFNNYTKRFGICRFLFSSWIRHPYTWLHIYTVHSMMVRTKMNSMTLNGLHHTPFTHTHTRTLTHTHTQHHMLGVLSTVHISSALNWFILLLHVHTFRFAFSNKLTHLLQLDNWFNGCRCCLLIFFYRFIHSTIIQSLVWSCKDIFMRFHAHAFLFPTSFGIADG